MTVADISEPSPSRSNVEWGAVLAGATITTALALILLAFGAVLGLGLSSPYDGEGLSPVAFAIAAGLYLLWVQVMSFYCGGYVAARLRARAAGASEHEVDVRDGLHGLLVWGAGVIAAAAIATVGIGGIGAAAHAPLATAQLSTSVSRVVDQQVQASAAQEASDNPQAADASTSERRAEIARKFAVISAFITAASLLAGAVAAFFGAHSGGHHRDKNVSWEFFTSSARPRRVGQ
ncbi:MAG: hypothetical protein ABUS48_05515 [Pseudomonadota bacterium]